MPIEIFKNISNKCLNKLGYRLEKISRPDQIVFPIDMEENTKTIIASVKPYSMTSIERLYGLIKAIDYISACQIDGDIVECGVWKGGSMMAAAKRLLEKKTTNRHLWLYDTYEGMPAPTAMDYSKRSGDAKQKFIDHSKEGSEYSDWCCSGIEEVIKNLKTVSYPENKLHFIKGKVEKTIPSEIPDRIALLRLDTDWYESTAHELKYLYPLLVTGGVIIIDDYGHWEGCRKAVDEFMANLKSPPLLNRIDYTCRIGVKY